MKRFLIIFFILLLLPVCAFAATQSPTLEKLITCKPEIKFELADNTEGWDSIITRLQYVSDEAETFTPIEALKIYLDKEYETIEWYLPYEITSENEPFIFIIDSEAIVKQETPINEDGAIITDFTDYEPGIYYIVFYIKGT